MKIPDSSAYEMLGKYGIQTAKWASVRNLEEALVAAENMHFPLVLKADSPDIMHKMRSGCIRTAVDNSHFRKMFEAVVKNAKPYGNLNGIIVQEMIRSDTENVQEFIVGAKLDDQFGMVVMFGAGGRATGLEDVSFRLVPLSRRDAKQLVREPTAAKLLTRHGKVEDALMKVSKLAEFEKISEMDINPLLVSDKGVLAVDVRIIM